jgi:hypothetical protein
MRGFQAKLGGAKRALVAVVAIVAWPAGVCACGAATGLDLGPDEPGASADGEAPLTDSAGMGASSDGRSSTGDAGPDGEGSRTQPSDASAQDSSDDRSLAATDACGTAAPSIVATANLDAGATCPPGDGGSTAYLVAESGEFYSFDLSLSSAVPLGRLTCAATPGASPFNMAISEDGAAYVLYSDGNLFRIDPHTLACTSTPFQQNQLGFASNVAIAIASSGGSEKFFVYGANGPISCENFSQYLAASDLSTFVLREVGPIAPNPGVGYPPAMTGDAFGRLFSSDAAGNLLEIDPTSGGVLGEDYTGLEAVTAWALLASGNELYFFTQSTGIISRYDLVTRGVTSIGSVGEAIAGAAVAPCLPQ